MSFWIKLLLPFAFDMVKEYIKSTDSTKDDKVLNIVQEGASYLAVKDNNTLNDKSLSELDKAIMIGDNNE